MNKGGFIVSRTLFESEIRFAPPEYLKIWIYILGKCNHKGKKYRGYYMERGECLVDYEELHEQLKYKIGYRKKVYNENLMKSCMKYLRKQLMVTTAKQPRGVLVKVVNYDKYQDLSNYEATSETTTKQPVKHPVNNQTPLSINKNDKNIIEDNKLSSLKEKFGEKIVEEKYEELRNFNKQYKDPHKALTNRLSKAMYDNDLLEIVERWNNVGNIGLAKVPLPQTEVVHNLIKKDWCDLMKDINKQQFEKSVNNYIGYIKKLRDENNWYYKNRYTLHDFIKKDSGARKFINFNY